MCEDKEEVRAAGRGPRETSPTRLCWGKKAPQPLADTRGMCCAKLLRRNGKPKKVRIFYLAFICGVDDSIEGFSLTSFIYFSGFCQICF